MKFKLETLTPVHIGKGDTLSPYSDFIQDEWNVYYINKDKLYTELFQNHPQMVDSYLSVLKRQEVNQNERKSLKDIIDAVNLDYKEVAEYIIPHSEDISLREISQTLSIGHRPYLPGSTIKGAIRTAIIYDYITKFGYGLDNIKNYKKKREPYIGQDLFDKFNKDKMKFLSISDSNKLQRSNLTIANTVNYNLDKQKTGIPQVFEVIGAGKRANISINTTAKKSLNKDISNYLELLYEGNEVKLLPIINQFYQDNIEKEIERVEPFDELIDLYTKYKEIYNIAENFNKSGKGAIMRLGAGKTYFDNTITRGISDCDFNSILKKDKTKFPVTRTVIAENNEIVSGLGWVKIYVD